MYSRIRMLISAFFSGADIKARREVYERQLKDLCRRRRHGGVSMKRLLAVYLMLFLFAGSLTGCGGSNQENVPEEIVWVLLEEDEKQYNNLAGIQKIEEATGVNITFELMTKEEYNYMLASGKYPDVMVAYLYNGEVLDLLNRGVAIEVSELVENNSTYLKAIYEDNPDIYREAQTNDGKLIYFPSLNPMKSNEDFYRLAYSGLIIRQDWLDKLGLGIPTDIEEWHTVLTAFKTRDCNVRSPTLAVYPFTKPQFLLPFFRSFRTPTPLSHNPP